ncbi:Uncharacterised protein [Fusobacterium necrophorum subsp. necrophorum]|nr:Uncharacterised protein [Fusobacterium necrophorum subsp. necrophorum]
MRKYSRSHVILRSFVPVEEEMIQEPVKWLLSIVRRNWRQVLVDYTQKNIEKTERFQTRFVSYTHEKESG